MIGRILESSILDLTIVHVLAIRGIAVHTAMITMYFKGNLVGKIIGESEFAVYLISKMLINNQHLARGLFDSNNVRIKRRAKKTEV